MKRIMIAGGGTGGHVYPGLALAEALEEKWTDLEVVFVGTERGVEGRVVSDAGYTLNRITVRAFPRSPSWGWVTFWFALAKGFGEAVYLIRALRPAVIVGTGGYVSAPVAWAGFLMRVPVVLLEQNRVLGLATRAAAPIARRVCLTFPDSARRLLRRDNVVVTGNPVRRRIIDQERSLGPPDRVQVFVFGGSRGAHQINALLVEALEYLPPSLGVEFRVQTGEADRDWVERRFRESGFQAAVGAYFDRIEEAYAAADLVVCRAGATTLAEITARGLPSILIPYPYAAAGHQEANAEFLAGHDAAVVLSPREVTAADLAGAIRKLVEEREHREAMAANAQALGKPEAAAQVAALVGALAGVS